MKELHVTEESVDVQKTLQATESIAEVIWWNEILLKALRRSGGLSAKNKTSLG